MMVTTCYKKVVAAVFLVLFVTYSAPDTNAEQSQRKSQDSKFVSDNPVSPSRGLTRAPANSEQRSGLSTDQRTYEGHNNNLSSPDMGSANSDLERWIPMDYEDAISQPAGTGRRSGRDISNRIFDQAFSQPNPVNASDYLWQWGQFLDHDIDLTDGMDPPESMPIAVPTGDPYFDPDNTGNAVIPFNRSIYNLNSGDVVGNPRQQLNEISAWIDASNVYGSDPTRAAALRKNDGSGQLKTSTGNLLPFNTDGLPNAGGSGSELYLAGDVRANEQAGLTAMHTLFVREHNRLAVQISIDQPELNGEEVYQKARRIVGGIVQYITYEEFLPVLLGPDAIDAYQFYDPQENANISSVFSTAAYRFGHSALSPAIRRVMSDGSVHPAGHLDLRDAFFAPDVMTQTGSFESILRGLSVQVCQDIDARVIDDVRNFLFGPPGAGGLDLVSLNIQRGRDHGLNTYNQVRQHMGLAPKQSFAEISTNPDVQARLQDAYTSVNDIDPWVGGLVEDHVPNAMVGELVFRLVKKQFVALRDGDRFWYQSYLDIDELNLVEGSTLAEVIRRNTSIDLEISDNVFIVENLIDSDLDGIADIRDNCLDVANENQIDADNDGYGNLCDADLDNDGVTNFLDFGLFINAWLSTDPVSDLNTDGIVNGFDFFIFRERFLTLPGPSGLHNW